MAETPEHRPRGTSGPLLGIVLFLVVAGALFWVLRPHGDHGARVEAAAPAADSAPPPQRVVPPGRQAVSVSVGPDFEGQDIRQLPLGTILDYAAHSLTFDEARGSETRLPGSGATVRIDPERSVGYLTRKELGEGRIVARIRSDSAVPSLGLASGLNYLYTEKGGAGLHGIIIPATAFSPLHEVDHVATGKPASRAGAPTRGVALVQVKGEPVPWVACVGC